MLKRTLILALALALPAAAFAAPAHHKSVAHAAHHHHKHGKHHHKKAATPSKKATSPKPPELPAAAAESASAVVESAKVDADVPYSGAWEGRFSGKSSGNLTVQVTEAGVAKVHCVVDGSKTEFDLSGPVAANGEVSAVEKSFGPAGIKVHFKGALTHKGTASGTWENPFFHLTGTWDAKRIAPQ